MEKNKNIDYTKAIERIENTLKSIKENDFTIFFYTMDTKNVPNSSVMYEYELAKVLNDHGYNVKMIYQIENEYTKAEIKRREKLGKPIDEEKVFEGVGKWLGEEYAKLPHMNIMEKEWKISPADILFIPEVFSSMMFQTYKQKAPCHRIVLVKNYDDLVRFIPLGVEWKNYGIYEAIAPTERQAQLIQESFPYVKVDVLPPYVHDLFRKPILPKKLIVNIVSKDQNDINKIIKTFYWKYPNYKFVSFRDLRNFPREKYAEFMRESAITVWVDNNTSFGMSALEAMKSECIVVGKIPDEIPEWMKSEDGDILSNGLWTYSIMDIPNMIMKAVNIFLFDENIDFMNEDKKKALDKYSSENWNKNSNNIMKNIIKRHIKDIKGIEEVFKSKNDKIINNEGNNDNNSNS